MNAPKQIALIKFNGGVGALLCNRCHTILATGFDYEDREHFCIACKAEEIKADRATTPKDTP